LPQMGLFMDLTEREVRQEAFEAVAGTWRKVREPLDDLYSRMVALRTAIARQADLADYRAYAFIDRKRFDYTPETCAEFHDGVAREVVPLVTALREERRKQLGVDTLRPWDLAVDPAGRPPLRPFSGGA